MATTYATISGRITRGDNSVGVWAQVIATPLTSDGIVITDEALNIGPTSPIETDKQGNLPTGASALKIPMGGTPSGIYWRFDVKPLAGPVAPFSLGTVQVTGDMTIQQVRIAAGVTALVVTPTLVTDVTAARDATFTARDATFTARDAALAVPTTTDTLIAGRVNDSASATTTALAAKYVQPAGKSTTGPAALLPFFNVGDYGAKGDGTTDDTAAIQAAIAAATASQGIVMFAPKVYAYAGSSTLTLPKGVSLMGSHVPSADVVTRATGTTLLRIGNNVGLRIVSTDRVNNRIGANRVTGIRFLETANISALPTLQATYADSIVLQDSTFWQSASTTTKGHAIAATDCWDWRLQNVIFKECGLASANTYGLYLFNGNVTGGLTCSCNDWDFIHCRWQESAGTSIFFDSSGTGTKNTLFDFTACKFEDARGASAKATMHVDGDASDVTFYQTEFAGALTKHCNVGVGATRWTWNGCLFANLQAAAVESLTLAGTNCKVVASHFYPMTVPQLINITGSGNAVIGCTQSGTAVPFNSNLPTTTLMLSPALGYSSIGGVAAPSASLTVGNATSGATTQYGVLANPTFGSDGTNSINGFAAQLRTFAAAYTVNLAHGVRVLDAVKGAGSTVTTQVGVQVDNQTQGTNNFAIRTGTGRVSLGDALVLTAAAGTASAGQVVLGNGSQATVGATGAATALPANPLGYLVAFIGTTKIAIPYYTG